MRLAGPLTAVCAGMTLIAACGGGDGGTPPPTAVLTSVSVNPTSLSLVDGDEQQLSATPLDQNGQPIAGLGPTFTVTTGGDKASVTSTGLVRALAPTQGAPAMVRVSFTAGAITKTTDIPVTVSALPTTRQVTATVGAAFSPAEVKLATGGTVTWTFAAGNTHNVLFDGPKPVEGDIAGAHTNDEQVTRTFSAAGEYNYHCGFHAAMAGKVIVRVP